MLPRERGKAAARAIGRTADDKLSEAISLTEAIGLEVTAAATVNLSTIRPSTLIGTGTLKDWHDRAHFDYPSVIIFNAIVSSTKPSVVGELSTFCGDRSCSS